MNRLNVLSAVRCVDAPTVLRRRVSTRAAALRISGGRCTHMDLGSHPRIGKALPRVPCRSRSSKIEGQGGLINAQKPSSRLRLTHALEKEVHLLQMRLRTEGAKFDKWRRRNVAMLLTIGGVAGGMILAVLGTVYVRRHPQIIDYVIAWLAKVEFDATQSYEDRKQLYMDLPEPQFSVTSVEAKVLAALADGSTSVRTGGDQAIDDDSIGKLALAWASMTTSAFETMGGSWLLATKAEMRRKLIDEICSARFSCSDDDGAGGHTDSSAAIVTRVAELRDILPLSLERNIYVAQELSKYLDAQSPEDRCAFTASPNVQLLGCLVAALVATCCDRAFLRTVPPCYGCAA